MLAAEANTNQYRVVTAPDDPDDFRIYIGDGLGHKPRIEACVRTDADFFVTPADVYPNGHAILIMGRTVRAGFRESLSEPTLLTGGYSDLGDVHVAIQSICHDQDQAPTIVLPVIP